MLEVFVQDVGGVGEEVGPHVRGGGTGQLTQVADDLGGGVPPSEVRVGLMEADLGEGVHHRRASERLREEDHIRVGAVHLRQQPLPERQRLGVGVVHPEDPDPVIHPVPHDPQRLGVEALGVVVEVERVDVLVFLGRVLRIGDRAVGSGGEPFRVLGDPGVVRRCLQGQVERDLEPQLAGPPDEFVEVGEGAELGVDGVVPTGR